jgi:metal-dependent amidase/aminoacylase/carboxypeptidase family protein
MKVDSFKKLIKEAVAEAVREELNTIFNEKQKPSSIQEMKTLNYTSDDVMNVRTNIREKMGNMFGMETPSQNNNHLKVDNNNQNPYLSFIADAAATMTPQERAGLNNLG